MSTITEKIDKYLAEKSEKIQVKNKWYYVDVKDLNDKKVTKLFLFQDPNLKKAVKTAKGTLMVKKSDLEDKLK